MTNLTRRNVVAGAAGLTALAAGRAYGQGARLPRPSR